MSTQEKPEVIKTEDRTPLNLFKKEKGYGSKEKKRID